MRIQLNWNDPATGQPKQPSLETPIALGSDFSAMPDRLSELPVSRMVINAPAIAPFHALIEEVEGELIIGDRSPDAGILINGTRLPSSSLFDGDRLQIGDVEIRISRTTTGCDRQVGFLWKRRCGRLDPVGCPHCQGSPYEDDYRYYRGFGSYQTWGQDYYLERNSYSYDRSGDRVDFTEADALAFRNEGDKDFERDMGAS